MVQSETTSPFFAGTKSRSVEQTQPRPPTPPRESPRSASKTKRLVEKDCFADSATESLVESSSREITPPSSSGDNAAGKPKKRVGWSPWTKYHKPDSPLSVTPIRSAIDPKSLKSILKPYSSPIPLFDDKLAFEQPVPESLPKMLESIVQALESTERSKKIDAYFTFSNSIKAYDNLPDLAVMREKVPTLCAFIKRDFDAKLDESGKSDSQLIQQAIKVLTVLVWTPTLVEAIDDGMASWFLQTAIDRVQDGHTSKLIVNHLLHLIAQQRFSVRIMTSERSNQIITALDSLDQRVTGKSITRERIDIYFKLLQQSKQTMLTRVNDWMDNLFGGLLSSVKEVRNRALACVAEIPRAFGSEKSTARCLSNIFSRDVGGGKRMFELIKERLEFFIKDGEGVFVARMWGVVLLLIRVSATEQWEFFTHWLRVIEGCFNVSDKDVKVEAQMAWQKLIYAMNIGPTTARKLLELLCKPLGQYLDPKNALSNTKRPRMAAMVNISVLLYYGFRPNALHKQLSEIWDVVVVGVLEKLALSSKDEVEGGCKILSAVFEGSTQKPWSEDRALKPPTMSPNELPRLDPKWVRSNTAIVLRTVEVALRRTPWKISETEDGPKLLWARFVKAVADAGSKEIKISGDLMDAVAQLLALFRRIWKLGPAAFNDSKDGSSESFIKKFSFLVNTALSALGTFPFTEKLLSLDEDSNFAPAATPMHKYSSGNNSTIVYSPILHMMSLFLLPAEGVVVDKEYHESVKVILWKCCSSQDSRRKKLALIASCAILLPYKDADSLDLGMWQTLADLVALSLPIPTRERILLSPSPAGGEFRDAVKVLEWGCRYDLPGWESLLGRLSEIVQNEQGDAHLAVGIIDPLAEIVRHQSTDHERSLQQCKYLINRVHYSKTNPHGDGAFRTPFAALGRKPSTTELLEKLYDLIDYLLRKSYSSDAEEKALSEAITLLDALGDLSSRCPPVSLVALLKRTQEGVSLWILDLEHLIKTKHDEGVLKIVNAWTKIIGAIARLPQHDGKILADLATLVKCGLESRFKPIVNLSVKSWNLTFGEQESIIYPKRVRAALKRLRPIADLKLPSFPDEQEDDIIPTPPQFSESQEKLEELIQEKETWTSPTPSRSGTSPFKSRSRVSSPLTGPREGLLSSRPRRSLGTRNLQTTPARPKHMDSQIEFAAIETDPVGKDSSISDSQLTERQKEVKERQSETATLFGSLNANSASKRGRLPKDSAKVTGSPRSTRLSRSPTKDSGRLRFGESLQAKRSPTDLPESPLSKHSGISMTRVPEVESTVGPVADITMDSPGAQDTEDEMIDILDDAVNEAEMRQGSGSLSVEDDNFVDAPEDRISSGEEVGEIPKNSANIAVEISPVQDSKVYDEGSRPGSLLTPVLSENKEENSKISEPNTELDHPQSRESSPGAQIMTEERSASKLPAKRRRARPRPRRRSIVRKASESPKKVSGTIVVAEPDVSQSKSPTSSHEAHDERAGCSSQKSQSNQISSPSKNSSSPRKPSTVSTMSPPATRSSVKKAAITESPAPTKSTRKRKLEAVEHYGSNNDENPSFENLATPTPKRRNTASLPLRRTRSSTKQESSKNNDSGPDVSFVEETQLSINSSIDDSQDHVDELVGPTPYAGSKAHTLFTEGTPKYSRGKGRLDSTNTQPESVEDTPNTPRTPRRLKKKSLGTPNQSQDATPKVESEKEVGPGSSKKIGARRSLPTKQPETVSEPTNGEAAIEGLQKALRALESANLTPDEFRRAENILFDAFSQLRRKGTK
ncbi:hypothetical protein L873DRAFT_1709380 [Choiromyces venosus 120613-1]|uniref:Telomere-associated protein Rif1 N-terminal domain-containing protein n=1 Tax=Choiromyces venosus 120613-1 TaxID=1336337 RepID=A0A3N4J673_9PEZI|nr:hypothetical protein L873DRAFT_1709380 [Choiromyces venosus 120613-1]